MGNIFGKASLSEEDRKSIEELKAGMQPFLDTGFEAKFAVFETLKNINENEVDNKKNAINQILSDYKIKGKDINQKDALGNTPLNSVAGNAPLLEFLIKKFPNIDLNIKDSKGDSPIFFAASLPQGSKSLEILHKYGANLQITNNNGQNIFCANISDHNPSIPEIVPKNRKLIP